MIFYTKVSTFNQVNMVYYTYALTHIATYHMYGSMRMHTHVCVLTWEYTNNICAYIHMMNGMLYVLANYTIMQIRIYSGIQPDSIHKLVHTA